MKRIKYTLLSVLGIILLTTTSCSDNNNTNEADSTAKGNYFVAATQGDFTYMLSVDDLESGTASIVGNKTVIEEPYSFTAFINNADRSVTAMQYRQGDPSIGMSYHLNAEGVLQKTGNEFQLEKGYGTWGSFDKYIVAARSGQTLTDGTIGAVTYLIDQENGNAVTTKYLSTTGLNGGVKYNGVQESGTISGIVDRGSGTFLTAAIFSHGVSSGNGGSATAVVGNPDECWILELDQNLKVVRTFQDDRISYSAGRFRSAYYSQIANDDKDNIYVFSGAYENASTKKAAVIRIAAGGNDFDSYYWDLETQSGGYRFRKVWHITDDSFLIEFYNEKYETLDINSAATQYAVVKMGSKDFKWITSGFPAKEKIVATGWPFAHDGKMYLPVTTDSAQPTVYVIDPTTATAKAGLVIQAEGIAALTHLTY